MREKSKNWLVNINKSEYAIIEENSRKEIEIQKLQLEKQKAIMEKDWAFEKYRTQIEADFKELKDVYKNEKQEMLKQLEQTNIQAKAFQMLSANETYLSPVCAFTLKLFIEKHCIFWHKMSIRINGKEVGFFRLKNKTRVIINN